MLASEVQTLNGVSTEAVGTMLEASFGMLVGIALSFVFSWKVALVALGTAPLTMFGAAMNAKL